LEWCELEPSVETALEKAVGIVDLAVEGEDLDWRGHLLGGGLLPDVLTLFVGNKIKESKGINIAVRYTSLQGIVNCCFTTGQVRGSSKLTSIFFTKVVHRA
jgi:hypothetical protein